MGLTGMLLQVSLQKCPFCSKEYGKHSKKGYMRCLAAASVNLHRAIQENDKLRAFIEEKIKEESLQSRQEDSTDASPESNPEGAEIGK